MNGLRWAINRTLGHLVCFEVDFELVIDVVAVGFDLSKYNRELVGGNGDGAVSIAAKGAYKGVIFDFRTRVIYFAGVVAAATNDDERDLEV